MTLGTDDEDEEVTVNVMGTCVSVETGAEVAEVVLGGDDEVEAEL